MDSRNQAKNHRYNKCKPSKDIFNVVFYSTNHLYIYEVLLILYTVKEKKPNGYDILSNQIIYYKILIFAPIFLVVVKITVSVGKSVLI